MNEVKLAILRSMGLANNGYSAKVNVITDVARSLKVPVTDVTVAFRELEDFNHVRWLGTSPATGSIYCLPEDYTKVQEVLRENARHGR